MMNASVPNNVYRFIKRKMVMLERGNCYKIFLDGISIKDIGYPLYTNSHAAMAETHRCANRLEIDNPGKTVTVFHIETDTVNWKKWPW
jgi:hypothetical protein